MRRSKLFLFVCLALVVSMLAGTSVRAADKVQIRWYVGLGAGGDAPTIAAQQEVVKAFNASQNKIELVLEVVDNKQAYDVLNTQIAAGNAPDVVGPMGVRGRASFPGAWMDLTDLIKETKYDLSDFDPALVNFYKIQGEGQLGIPFAVYPSFLYVNTDLFEEAGIALPPTKYGEQYVDKDGNKKDWDLDTVREIAMQLTVDKNGKNASEEGFDPENIVQFGFGQQYTDIRGQFTMFGSGNFVDANGKAQFPANWVEGAKWLQNAMFKDHFYPTTTYGNSDILGKGNWFESGNIAMDQVHTWYTCCFAGLKANWNIYPMPSYKGKATAKLHADTFGILKGSKHPKEAFTVLSYLLGEKAEALTTVYGGMPARLSLQKDYFTKLAEKDPFKGHDINVDVIKESLKYNDNPNHEEGMPNFLESSARYGKFGELLNTDPKFDIDAGAKELVADLQKLFDTKK